MDSRILTVIGGGMNEQLNFTIKEDCINQLLNIHFVVEEEVIDGQFEGIMDYELTM